MVKIVPGLRVGRRFWNSDLVVNSQQKRASNNQLPLYQNKTKQSYKAPSNKIQLATSESQTLYLPPFLHSPDLSFSCFCFLLFVFLQVWDVISNEEAVEIVSSTPDRAKAAKRLVENAVRAWRRKRRGIAMDDISAICLFFHTSPLSPQQNFTL